MNLPFGLDSYGLSLEEKQVVLNDPSYKNSWCHTSVNKF